MISTFLNPPIHHTVAEFRAYLDALAFPSWRPKFPTLHNTGVPSLKQWLAMGTTPQERWGANLNRYYQGMGWHAGPHLVVCRSYIWVLCDLTKSGVSVSCWNSQTFGVEMVGNYEVGGDDFATGDGALVRDNAVAALAILAETFGWGDLSDIANGERGLHFHHDCVRDHHVCPGSLVTKSDVLARVAAERARSSERPIAASEEKPAPTPLASVGDLQSALNALGAEPSLKIDNNFGPLTIAAIKQFQAAHDLPADGRVSAETLTALEIAIERPVARRA